MSLIIMYSWNSDPQDQQLQGPLSFGYYTYLGKIFDVFPSRWIPLFLSIIISGTTILVNSQVITPKACGRQNSAMKPLNMPTFESSSICEYVKFHGMDN